MQVFYFEKFSTWIWRINLSNLFRNTNKLPIFLSLAGTLRNEDGDGNWNSNNTIGGKQNNNSAHSSGFFSVNFFAVLHKRPNYVPFSMCTYSRTTLFWVNIVFISFVALLHQFVVNYYICGFNISPWTLFNNTFPVRTARKAISLYAF